MKLPVSTVILFLSFCMITTSCKENTKKNVLPEYEDTIDKILIQFYPVFNSASLMQLDLSTEQLTFQRIGLKTYYRPIPPKDIVEIIAPKSINFKIDSLSNSYFRDISFNGEDFTDREELCDDGISHAILYVFKSGRIEDVDLVNSMTENQHRLIIRLIDLNILYSTDSITTEYLKDLRDYHH